MDAAYDTRVSQIGPRKVSLAQLELRTKKGRNKAIMHDKIANEAHKGAKPLEIRYIDIFFQLKYIHSSANSRDNLKGV